MTETEVIEKDAQIKYKYQIPIRLNYGSSNY